MRKMVYGKIVDIDNIELIEKGLEGIALGCYTTTSIDVGMYSSINNDSVDSYIKQYNSFYKSLPFPLYGIESDLKYATLGRLIKYSRKDNVDIWVDNGLFISIPEDNKIAIKFVGMTWGLEEVGEIGEDNTSLYDFGDQLGYKEYSWILDKTIKKESIADFYEEFMGEFAKACYNQPILMKFQLNNILKFTNVPKRIRLKDDKIMRLEDNAELTLDMYTAGRKPNGNKEYTLSLVRGCNNDLRLRNSYTQVFGFNCYEKEVDRPIKRTDTGLTGISNLFTTLSGIRIANEENGFRSFKGLMCDGDLVYIIDNRIFYCKAYKPSQVIEVASGAEFYSYENGILYFIKTTDIGKGIRKEVIYRYSIRSESTRLCSIHIKI